MSVSTGTHGNPAGGGTAVGPQRLVRSVLRHARRSIVASVDYYEHSVAAITDFHDRVAAMTIEPAASLGAAYADLTRELTHAQIVAVRVLLEL